MAEIFFWKATFQIRGIEETMMLKWEKGCGMIYSCILNTCFSGVSWMCHSLTSTDHIEPFLQVAKVLSEHHSYFNESFIFYIIYHLLMNSSVVFNSAFQIGNNLYPHTARKYSTDKSIINQIISTKEKGSMPAGSAPAKGSLEKIIYFCLKLKRIYFIECSWRPKNDCFVEACTHRSSLSSQQVQQLATIPSLKPHHSNVYNIHITHRITNIFYVGSIADTYKPICIISVLDASFIFNYPVEVDKEELHVRTRVKLCRPSWKITRKNSCYWQKKKVVVKEHFKRSNDEEIC